MDVAAGGVDLAEADPVALLREELAALLQHLLAEGRGGRHLRVEQHAALVPVRAVAAGIGGEVNAFDHIQAHLVAGDLGQLGGGELVDELLPLGVVEGRVLHLNEGDAVVLLVLVGGDVRGVGGLFVLEVLHQVLDLRGGGEACHRVGEGVPVGTGQVGHGSGDEVVDIPVLEVVGHHLAGIGGDGVGRVVQAGQLVLVGLGGIALHRIALGVEHPSDAPGGQHVVQRVVGVAADGKEVLAGVEHVAACLGAVRPVGGIAVIGGEDVVRELQGHGLALPRRQGGGLGEVGQLDGALFRLPRLVGELDVELHHVLALAGVVGRAVVGHLHLGGDGVGGLVPVHAQQLLGKAGVAFARAEGEHHLVGVVPSAVLAGVHALGAVGVVDAQHLVLVAGLIVLVAHIDTLGVHQVLVLILAGEVVEGEVAGVLHGGGAEGVGGVGDDVAAGGVGLAAQHPGHAGHAVVAGVADPQTGVHTVVRQPAQIHGVAGVEHHDDLVELAGIPDHVEGVDLVLVEGQLGYTGGALLPVALEAVVQVALLAAEAAHDVDGGVVVAGRVGALRPGVGAGGDLADESGLGAGAVGGHDGVVHRLVDLEALLLHGVVEVDAVVGRAAGAAVVDRGGGGEAEQRHAGVGGQGERPVFIAQQYAALLLALDEVVLQGGAHLVHGGIAGGVVVGVAGDLDGRGKGAQEQVHVPFPGEGQALAEHGKGEDQHQEGAKSPPYVCFFHEVVLPITQGVSARHINAEIVNAEVRVIEAGRLLVDLDRHLRERNVLQVLLGGPGLGVLVVDGIAVVVIAGGRNHDLAHAVVPVIGVQPVGLVIAQHHAGGGGEGNVQQVVVQVVGFAGAGAVQLINGICPLVALGVVGALGQLQGGEGGGGEHQAVGIVIHQRELLVGEGGEVVVILGPHILIAQVGGAEVDAGDLTAGAAPAATSAVAGGQRQGHRPGQEQGNQFRVLFHRNILLLYLSGALPLFAPPIYSICPKFSMGTA